MNHLEKWNLLKQPPVSALKQIEAGRLKGKSDIRPQWRYQIMTEVFGVCGIGWKYEVVRVWREEAINGEIFAFAEVNVYVKDNEQWSAPIPATGGSMLVEMETKGLYVNDEGYKMAVTDALGTAMKMLGVAADIYLNLFDGTKYKNATSAPQSPVQTITEAQAEIVRTLITDTNTDLSKFLAAFGIANIGDLPVSRFEEAKKRLEEKKAKVVSSPKMPEGAAK